MAVETVNLPAYIVSAAATTPTQTPIRPRDYKDPVVPKVFYLNDTWAQIRYLIDKCTQEVGWLGLVEKRGNDYYITEIFVPEQQVHGAETDISGDSFNALGMQLLERNLDPGQLYYWGHSHVNMGVTPSKQDEDQIAAYLEHCPVFIRGIYNKPGQSKVDVYDVAAGVCFQCVSHTPVTTTPPWAAEFDELIRTNVKPAITTYRGEGSGARSGNQSRLGQIGRTYFLIGKGAKEYAETLARQTA